MIFQNEQLELSSLPQSEKVEYTRLLSKYKTLQFIQLSIFLIVSLIAGTLFYLVKEIPTWLFVSFIAALFLFGILRFIIIHIGFPYKGYAVREHDVHYKSGYLSRNIVSIPINRIQHMEIRQGVISRMLKLSKLKIYTAGNSSSDLSLKGISPETAGQIKQLLSEKINEYERH